MVASISSLDLIERLCRLTNKIYREILCLEVDGRMSTIVLRRPFHTLDIESVPHKFRETPYKAAIQLSWELLAWASVEGKIHSSFTKFITTPEISGPLYISPDVY